MLLKTSGSVNYFRQVVTDFIISYLFSRPLPSCLPASLSCCSSFNVIFSLALSLAYLTGSQIDLESTCSLSKCLKQLEQSQASEARIHNGNWNLIRVKDPINWAITCCFSGGSSSRNQNQKWSWHLKLGTLTWNVSVPRRLLKAKCLPFPPLKNCPTFESPFLTFTYF